MELDIKRWLDRIGSPTVKDFAAAAGTKPVTFFRVRHGEKIAQSTAEGIVNALGPTVGLAWWTEVGQFIVSTPARRTLVLGSVSTADGMVATMRDMGVAEVPVPQVSADAFAIQFDGNEMVAAGVPAGAHMVFEPATAGRAGQRVLAEFVAVGKPPLRMVRRLTGTPEAWSLAPLVSGAAPEFTMGPGWRIIGVAVGVFLPEP